MLWERIVYGFSKETDARLEKIEIIMAKNYQELIDRYSDHEADLETQLIKSVNNQIGVAM
jgi:hypothetical protein